MKRFVKIEYWDYMEGYPHTVDYVCNYPRIEVEIFEGANKEDIKKNVNASIAHRSHIFCSEDSRLINIMEQPEALIWIEQQIAKEHSNWQDDSQEFIDKICGLFKECYGEDAVELLHKLDMADDYASNQ